MIRWVAVALMFASCGPPYVDAVSEYGFRIRYVMGDIESERPAPWEIDQWYAKHLDLLRDRRGAVLIDISRLLRPDLIVEVFDRPINCHEGTCGGRAFVDEPQKIQVRHRACPGEAAWAHEWSHIAQHALDGVVDYNHDASEWWGKDGHDAEARAALNALGADLCTGRL